MEWKYTDGGRAEAGYKSSANDCVTRAIAIITERPYQEIYDLVNQYGNKERFSKNCKIKSSARNGVRTPTVRKILKDMGFLWVPTMQIGSGCKVHLKAKELPSGKIIANLSKHIVAVIDGVVYDTSNPSRNETRCVYGYWLLDSDLSKAGA
jgi:hypothetical protein